MPLVGILNLWKDEGTAYLKVARHELERTTQVTSRFGGRYCFLGLWKLGVHDLKHGRNHVSARTGEETGGYSRAAGSERYL